MFKKILTCFCLLLGYAERADAQTNVYHPFPDSNAVWCENAWWTNFGPPYTCVVNDDYQLFINGDTIIGAFQYHKLYASGEKSSNCGFPIYYSGKYKGAFRQDIAQKKVFYSDEYGSAEQLLYDFNLAVGSTLSYGTSIGDTVTSIDSVLIAGNYRKRFWLNFSIDAGVNGPRAFIIEGIGSCMGVETGGGTMPFESGTYLHSFTQNGQPLLVQDSFPCYSVMLGAKEIANARQLKIFPNPSAGDFTIDFGELKTSGRIEVMDMLGNIIFTEAFYNKQKFELKKLPAGIYTLLMRNNSTTVITAKIISTP